MSIPWSLLDSLCELTVSFDPCCSLEFQPPPYSAAPFPLDHFLGLSPAQTHRAHVSTSEGSRAPAERMKGEGSRILTSMSLRERSCERNGEDKTRSVPTNGDTDAVAMGGRGVVRVSPEAISTGFEQVLLAELVVPL